MLMRLNQEIFQVKYILISFLLVFVLACKEMTYNTLDNISKNECRKILNTEDRLKCENRKTNSYKDYKKYYEEK